jgi:hypothetical protein
LLIDYRDYYQRVRDEQTSMISEEEIVWMPLDSKPSGRAQRIRENREGVT